MADKVSSSKSRILVRAGCHQIPAVKTSRLECGAIEVVQDAEVDVPEFPLAIALLFSEVAKRFDFALFFPLQSAFCSLRSGVSPIGSTMEDAYLSLVEAHSVCALRNVCKSLYAGRWY